MFWVFSSSWCLWMFIPQYPGSIGIPYRFTPQSIVARFRIQKSCYENDRRGDPWDERSTNQPTNQGLDHTECRPLLRLEPKRQEMVQNHPWKMVVFTAGKMVLFTALKMVVYIVETNQLLHPQSKGCNAHPLQQKLCQHQCVTPGKSAKEH